MIASAQVVFYGPRTVDDLFISLRYAERWIGGLGLTYNDDLRVEGFSNLLWVMLQAVALALGAEGVTATKVLGVASLVGLMVAVGAYGRRLLGLSWAAVALAGLALASNSYVMAWGLWGLETPLYLALMVAFAVATDAAMRGPTRAATLSAAAAAVGLAWCRPEAPLYMAAVGLALLAHDRRSGAWRARLRAVLPAALGSAGVLGVSLALRRAYYGLWLPHTYYAKRGSGFDVAKLDALWSQGAHATELAALAAAACVAAWLVVRKRHLTTLAIAATCMFFVCSVEPDWMPSQRHLLPLWVMVAVALSAGAHIGWRRLRDRGASHAARAAGLGAAAICAAALLACAAHQARLDVRYSPSDFRSHGRSTHWTKPKTARALSDAWDCLRRQPPPHAEAMSVHHHGMITQLYRVLEASAAPEADTWYIGRDIGRVGYYSPVQIFDTPGLFTPAAAGTERPPIDPKRSAEAVRTAFAYAPAAAELLAPWSSHAGRHRTLWRDDYAIVRGAPTRPHLLRKRGLTPPSHEQLIARYDRVERKAPQRFYMMTLYGEAVGAAIERRAQWARDTLADAPNWTLPRAPDATPSAGIILDGAVVWHGCAFTPDRARPGEEVELACWMEARADVKRDYVVFVHLVTPAGHRRATADHPPLRGWLRPNTWPQNRIVRDTVSVRLPNLPPGTSLSARVGLFQGNHRAVAVPHDTRVDEDGRIIGPTVHITE